MLGAVQVSINGMDMPVLYASANQINAIVPMGIASGTGATIRIVNGSPVIPSFPVRVDPSQAQTFPTVLNQDCTINSASNPAALPSVVTFYATGVQPSFAPVADGQVATAAQNLCSVDECEVLPPGIVPAGTVVYAGAAPGIVAGVTQFNVEIGPDSFISCNSSNRYNFTVYALGASISQSVWVTC
jgi:uncharacterized protein (TIGR03437 family)